jgi:hypothetical protein
VQVKQVVKIEGDYMGYPVIFAPVRKLVINTGF